MPTDNLDLKWNNIRAINGDQREGFEEFVTQLARIEKIKGKKRFIRKGTPDAGVECYWILEDGSEWAWQAKYFTSGFGSSQWGQIDDSVEAAIEGHPNLSMYFIALPINPADDRQQGRRSLQNKWDEHELKWQELAKAKSRFIQFVAWWSSDLIKRLQSREAMGIISFWFNKDFLSDSWFDKHIEKSIADLQPRYTPELNHRMPIVKIFDGIAMDDKFRKQLYKILDPLLIEINNLSLREKNEEYCNKIYEIKKITKTLESEYNAITESSDKYCDFNTTREICEQIRLNISSIYSMLDNDKDKSISRDRRYDIAKISSLLIDFEDFIDCTTVKLSCQPYLLIYGEGGIGKSHLLGDIVTSRKEEGKYSLLLLGQQFNTIENPESQILKNLDLKNSFDELLTALSCRAQIARNRLIIFIDAINEGKGKEFWPDHLNGFLAKIAQYPWLGIVFTIRDTYLEIIKDNLESSGSRLLEYRYNGFFQDTYNAVKKFFAFYGIEQPSNPILDPEFTSPLFLKIYCISLKVKGLTRMSSGFQGNSELMKLYINTINDTLCKPKRFDYASSLNLVLFSVNAIIKYMIENRTRIVKYLTAIEIIDAVVTKYISIKGKYLDELISEGILSKNLMKEKSESIEYIYFTYERFTDYLICSFLIEKSGDLDNDLKTGGAIHQFLKDQKKFKYFNFGLLEALAIQLPEKTNKDIFEFLDTVEFPKIKMAFINSLKWRRFDTITDSCRTFINNNIINQGDVFKLFLDTIISIATVEKHCFNANYLHSYLMKYSLADRDASWSYFLKYRYSEEDPVKRLIDWAWNDDEKRNISNESIKLASITIAWFLSSSKRDLRDASTKALVSILQNRISVLIDVLKLFENVNDPYIYERLFAVAYGCVLRTNQVDQINRLVEYVFEIIFNKNDEIYPHILLRDYARNIIEYAVYLNLPLSFDISRVKPPYKSQFIIKELTNEQIDEKYQSTDENKVRGQDKILSSMVTEYGRGACMYGDFGRYVFEWKFYHFPVNPDILSNMAIDLIFEKYGYSEKKHGIYDTSLPYVGRQSKKTERIGKKYQWMAMHELLANVTDNFKRQSRYKYEENTPYQGPWEPPVRDIDPTVLIRRTGYLGEEETYTHKWWEKNITFNFNCSSDEWFSNTSELSVFNDIIKISDNENNSWLIIQAYPDWCEPMKIGEKRFDKEEKNIWAHIRSYICKKKNLSKTIRWAKKQNFSGRWMPENSDKYILFLREHYWSPAYKYCIEEDYDGSQVNIWEEIKDKDTGKVITSVIVPTEGYTWEDNTDYSIDETLNIIIPSKFLFEKLNMSYCDKEGEYIDSNKNIICYNPSVKYNTKQYLLIKEEPFLKFLQENDYEIFWTILGEKQLLGGDYSHSHGRLDFSGVCYLKNDGTVESSMNTFRLPRWNEVS
jgi:hypothetical protein